MADIRPLGRIHTVQVEVEPNVGENEVTEEGKEEAGGEEGAGREVREGEGEQEADGESGGEDGDEGGEIGKMDGVEELRERKNSQEQINSSPAPLQPSVQKLAGSAHERGALGRISPHSLPTVAEGLQEAASRKGKRSKKSKPLSTRDLLPLHQDVGRSNKQLLEPTTPEFQPTPDWVCRHYIDFCVAIFCVCLLANCPWKHFELTPYFIASTAYNLYSIPGKHIVVVCRSNLWFGDILLTTLNNGAWQTLFLYGLGEHCL